MHEAARQGYKAEAESYATARPSYHPDLVERLAGRYGDGVVVELGAGTGLLTHALAGAGCQVVAVEPVEEMRSLLAHAVPEAEVTPGTAEAIPVQDQAVDTVVAGQAFHWFDHGPALDEIHRCLRPGGALACAWNVRDETSPWMQALTALTDRHAGDTPRHRTMLWRLAVLSWQVGDSG